MSDALPLVVRVGQVPFWGDGDPLAIGYHLTPDGLKGWNDGVEPRIQSIERAQAHGDFDVPQFLGARFVTLEGWIQAESEAKLSWYQGQLVGLLAENAQQIVVQQFGRTTWARGRLGAKPTFDPYGGEAFGDFQLMIKCPNPRKFGAMNLSQVSGGSVVSFHYGNVKATSVLTVTGTATGGYTIYGPGGKTYTVTAAVTAGHPHSIDMATGLLMRDGVYVTGVVTAGGTWAVPPGTQVSQSITPIGGSLVLTALTPDTFI
jgi:hypothetical protein